MMHRSHRFTREDPLEPMGVTGSVGVEFIRTRSIFICWRL
jgi:hypothetical protein